MTKFIKKPVAIEAMQLTEDNIFDVTAFIDGKSPNTVSDSAQDKWQDYLRLVRANEGVTIKTFEGEMMVDFGDYIVMSDTFHYLK